MCDARLAANLALLLLLLILLLLSFLFFLFLLLCRFEFDFGCRCGRSGVFVQSDGSGACHLIYSCCSEYDSVLMQLDMLL